MRRIGLVVLAVVLAAAPAAAAHTGPTKEFAVPTVYPVLDEAYWAHPAAELTPDLAAALAAAQEHWGGPPACGPPVVRFVKQWPGSAVAWPDRCLIDINPVLGGRDFDFLCELVAHEVGHLHGLGHGHPGDPLYDPALEGTVMDYRTDGRPGLVPACERERERRERIERRLFELNDKGAARRDRCHHLRHRGRRARPECRRAARTSARLLALRHRVNWPLW